MKNRLNWKHITLLVVALAALIGLFTVPGSATSNDFDAFSDGIASLSIEGDPGDRYIVVGRVSPALPTASQIIIPDEFTDVLENGVNLGTLPVRKIAPGAFEDCEDVISVVFPETNLQEIGANAFSGTRIGANLTEGEDRGKITIPASVTTIGDYAFADNYLLNRVVVESGSTTLSIGANAFANCAYAGEESGTTVTYTNDTVAAPSHITSVSINRPVTIGASAFAGSRVGSVSIPYATTIGAYAFQNAALKQFTIPATLTDRTVPATDPEGEDQFFPGIGEHAFSGNNAAFELDENDPNYATTKVFAITSATGGTGTLTIEEYAFSDSSLENEDTTDETNLHVTSVTLPDREVIIGEGAFKGNRDMTTLVLGGTTTVGNCAFMNCGTGNNGNAEWPATITSVGMFAFDHCRLLGTVVATNVTTIGDYGFRGSSISSLTLPSWSTVSNDGMGEYVFAGLDRLAEVEIPADWPELPTGFFKALDNTNIEPGLVTVTFDGATAIGEEAFKGCTKLVTVSAQLVPSVGASAFKGCTALNKSGSTNDYFELPAAVDHQTVPEPGMEPETIPSIGNQAFYGCYGLKKVTLTHAQTIGESAFENCTGITELSMPEATHIGNRAFYVDNDIESGLSFSSMISLSMPNAQVIGVSAFENAGSPTANITGKLSWPSTVTSIGSRAFFHSKMLDAVTMDQNLYLTHIGTQAFEKSSITGLTLPANQPSTGYGTNGFADAKRIFADCDSLVHGADENTPVTIPSAWNLVPEETFCDCDALPSVTVGGAAALSKMAFYSCDALTTVTATSVPSVGQQTFYGCPVLASVDITSATTVGEAAFFNCTKLAALTCSNLVTVGKEAFTYVGADDSVTSFGGYNVVSNKLRTVGAGAFLGSKVFNGKALTLAGCYEVAAAAFAGTSPASVTFTDGIYNSGWRGCTVAGAWAFSGTTIEGNVTLTSTHNNPSTIGLDEGVTVFGATPENSGYEFTYGDGDFDPDEFSFDPAEFGAAEFGKLIVEQQATIEDNAFTGVTFNGMEIAGDGTEIGDYAFQEAVIRSTYADRRIYVTGEDVTFGDYAFAGATLNNVPVEVSDDGTGVTFGSNSFAGTSIKSLTVSGTGASFNSGAFQNATIADSVSIAGGTIGESAFQNAVINGNGTYEGTVTVSGTATVGSYAFAGAKFKTLNLSTGAITIEGDYAFAAGTEAVGLYPMEAETDTLVRDHTLTTVNLSAATISGSHAFCDRAGITTITYPASHPTGSYTFRGCSSLPSVTVPDGWTALTTGTFYGCDSMTYLGVPFVTSVGNFAYTTRGTEDSHTKIEFGVRVNSIDDHAFQSNQTNVDGQGPYSYLEIWVMQNPMYSISGWDEGWGAHQILDTHYWIYWMIIEEEEGLGSDFTYARIAYEEDGDGGYIVIGSRNYSRANLYTFLCKTTRTAYLDANGVLHYNDEEDYDWNPDIPENLRHQTALNSANVVRALGRKQNMELSQQMGEPVYDDYFFYYAYTKIIRTATDDSVDDIDSMDYRYGLFCIDRGIDLAEFEPETSDTPPVKSIINGQAVYYLEYSGGTYHYNFDHYLRDFYVIGDQTGEFNVTAIKDMDLAPAGYRDAFQLSDGATVGFEKIFVPDTVREIGFKAFYGEISLQNLTGEDENGDPTENPALHLTAPVGTSAFEGCTALTTINFDPSVNTAIGEKSFKDCAALANLGLTHAGNAVVNNVNWPSIGNYAFNGCSSLPSLTFETVGDVGISAFENAFTSGTNKTITINGISTADENITIGKRAFRNSSKLQALTFGDGATGNCTLGDHTAAANENDVEQLHGAFYNCDALTTVNWGGLTSVDIGAYTFYDCDALETVNWKKDTDNTIISFIGRKAFYDCASLQSVTIGQLGSPDNPAKIDASAFRQSKKLKTFAVEGGYVSEIGYAAFWETFSDTSVNTGDGGSFTMNAPVELLGVVDSNNIAWTLGNTPYLKTIAFTAVGKINSGAFYFNNNPELTGRTLTVNTLGVEGYDPDGESGAANAGDGLLADNALLNGRFETITISNGDIPTIGASAFEGNGMLKFVTLPNVTTLGAKAFKSCQLLEEVTFNRVVTISSYAFSSNEVSGYCQNLKSVTVNEHSVVNIYDHAFFKAGASSDVTALDWEVLNETLKIVGASAFEECKLLDEVVMPDGADVSVGSCAFKKSSVTAITFQNGAPGATGTNWFEECAGIKKVAFPTSNSSAEIPWTTIPAGTFLNCGNLGSETNDDEQSVNFGSITVIGAHAFEGTGTATGIERNTDIPSGIQEIGESAFEGCQFLKGAVLTNVFNEGGIGDRAFMNSSVGNYLDEDQIDVPLTLPDNYDGSAGVSAFEGCANLTTLSVPAGWAVIPNSMFAGTPLTSVTIGEENNDAGTTINAHAFSGCTELESVTIYGASTVGSSAFTSRIADYDFVGQPALGVAFAPGATVTMDKAKAIRASAFFDCANLETVNMAAIEEIDQQAFAGCTSLAYINYKNSETSDEMLLMKHNSFRAREDSGYTGYTADDQQYLYHYYDDPKNTAYDPNNPEGWTSFNLYDPEDPDASIYHNWKFSMCMLPNTLWSVGANAFSGTAIQKLYIADVKLSGSAVSGLLPEEYPFVNPPGEETRNYDSSAFAGIQNLDYMFIQHSYNPTAGAPWGAGQIEGHDFHIEWDDGIVSDQETGLYYNYTTGMIVGVYDLGKTILDVFPTNLHDGLMLNQEIELQGIDSHAFFTNSTHLHDIQIPADILEQMMAGNFVINGEAFDRQNRPDDFVLRITLLGFENQELEEIIAEGFGFLIPDDAEFGDSIVGKLDDHLTQDDLDAIEEMFGEAGINIESWGLTTESTWEDYIIAILERQGFHEHSAKYLSEIIEHLGGTVDPEHEYTWDEIFGLIGDGTNGTIGCTWKDILDLVIDAHGAVVEWLEQPTINFGSNVEVTVNDQTVVEPRVKMHLTLQGGYWEYGALSETTLFTFRVDDVPSAGTVPFGTNTTAYHAPPKRVEMTLESGWSWDTDHTSGYAKVVYDYFNAAVNRRLTYWVSGSGEDAVYAGYHPDDIDYRIAVGEETILDPYSNDPESHIMKLSTKTNIGIEDYNVVFDTIYCRVTFTRDNEMQNNDGTQNADYSINYTTNYEFLDPAKVNQVMEQKGLEERYEDLTQNEIIALFDDPDYTDPDNNDPNYIYCIVDHITFEGYFAKPKKLVYDPNVAGANRTLKAAIQRPDDPDYFTDSEVKLAEGMYPEVWMVTAYQTFIQAGVPTCPEKTVTVTVDGEQQQRVYKLVFAGWSTDPEDTSVNDDTPVPTDYAYRQFNQPYMPVKTSATGMPPKMTDEEQSGNPDDVGMTLYAVWKVSETKDVWVKYEDSFTGVRLTSTADQTPFKDPQNSAALNPLLTPRKYGYELPAFGTLPELDSLHEDPSEKRSYPLVNADGSVYDPLRDMDEDEPVWAQVYSIYVMHNSSLGLQWKDLQMKYLFTNWSAVSNSNIMAKITFKVMKVQDGEVVEEESWDLYTWDNMQSLYEKVGEGDDATYVAVQTIPTPTDPTGFTGWWTDYVYGNGMKVLDTDGTIYAGTGKDEHEQLLEGWYGGVNGWTLGEWVLTGANTNRWDNPRWVATGERTLYTQCVISE